uniref:High mobility group protein HMG-I/HMG-Y n=1 Tax=Nomascus leucogenys TaxID=61853 RepID=A0A2I3G7Y5_NOMLE
REPGQPPSPEPWAPSSNWDSEPGRFLALAWFQEASQSSLFHLLLREGKMSESSSKSSQPLASKQEKDGTEKPQKQPPVSPGTALVGSQKEPSEVPTPKRPRGRPKGSKNKGAAKTQKTTITPGRKPREEGISQVSSEEEQ